MTSMVRDHRRNAILGLIALAVTVVGVIGLVVYVHRSSQPAAGPGRTPERSADSYVAAFNHGDLPSVSRLACPAQRRVVVAQTEYALITVDSIARAGPARTTGAQSTIEIVFHDAPRDLLGAVILSRGGEHWCIKAVFGNDIRIQPAR